MGCWLGIWGWLSACPRTGSAGARQQVSQQLMIQRCTPKVRGDPGQITCKQGGDRGFGILSASRPQGDIIVSAMVWWSVCSYIAGTQTAVLLHRVP